MPPRHGRRNEIRTGSVDDATTQKARPPEFSPDGAVVTVVRGAHAGKSRALPGRVGAVLSVGKSRENDLVLDDNGVSRQHATIERTDAGLVIRDQGSTNGVTIGGARVREAIVGPGTIVGLGDAQLLVGVETRGVVIPPSANERFGSVVGSSPAMRGIFGILERIAPTTASVLLTGETGTGKDALARSICAMSPRAAKPFVVVDCGAVTPTLIESELFGHERGAFTGAVSARAGAFERGNGGTIFLDEIGELALELQPKLLRVLEAREFLPVGATKPQRTDVRVVAATTRDLEAEVGAGRFRGDLFFRLAVVTIRVPPLRERREELAEISRALLASFDPNPPSVSAATLAALSSHQWPGNVRELRNVLERALHMTRAMGASELILEGFPPRPRAEDAAMQFVFDDTGTYRETKAAFEARFERAYVTWLLERNAGNFAAAARFAQMDRSYLMALARKHGIKSPRS
jgi:transcriptional regulator with GAF, ATPase, and Fis domain